MNALSASGAKCTRLLVIIGLAALLASPAMLLWASRPAARSGSAMSEAEIEEIMLRQDARLIDMLAARIPEPTARPAEHAVFPERLASLAGNGHGKGKGLLHTSLGRLDPQNAEALMREIPQRLLLRPNEITRGERGGVAEGLNYVTLRQEAIAAKSLDAILERLQQDARIVGYLPNASFVVYAEAAQLRGLVQNPDVAFAMPVHPAFKISSHAGRKPFMERGRAADASFRLEVFLVPGVEARQVKEALAKISRVREVFEAGEAALRVNAHFSALPEIARLKGVSFIQEAPEWVNHNFKQVSLIQVGSGDEGLEIRAFDDAGVDGGGLSAAGTPTGSRVNDGTAQVPPQIVGVTDNGISLDTPSFSQTTTQVNIGTISGTTGGPSHRKVHSVQSIVGGGAGCDAVLSGAGTHGNVVASIIAANPTQLGVFVENRRQFSVSGSIPRINLDGVARGARILLQDVQADSQSACLVNSIIERGSEVNPGILLTRLNQMICPKSGGTGATCAPGGTPLIGGATEVHLAVLPFGIPNWTRDQFPLTNGKYSQEAADVDTFLYNNRDFMVVVPVGNNGGIRGNNRLQLDLVVMPDFFNGTDADDCPLPCTNPQPKLPQVSPPATAKNIISVGAHRGDCMSFFGNFDCEENQDKYASRGPATADSLRTAPILNAAGAGEVFAGRYGPATWANIRSNDDDNNDNGGQPLDVVLDENNFGTSFSSAGITGAAAIVRDYFAQGFYPTGSRTTGNRVPNVSGALVKAALVASAHFNTDVRTQGQDANEANLRRTRAMDVGSPAPGVTVGVIGNNEVGYGRVVLTQVLPLANWSKTHIVGAYGAPNRNRQEHPAAALLVYDDLATGEPLINNTTTSVSHTFLVNSSNLVDTNGATAGGIAVQRGELRIGLAWPDPPSPPSTAELGGGELVNDLDLKLESPGPDNNLATTGDNRLYYGNVYDGGFNSAVTDPWAKSFTTAQPATNDKYNPVEGIHITSDKDNNLNFSDSQIFTGTWRITVSRGSGGATPGVITIAPGIPAGPNGEDNGAGGNAGNRRLDAGEDANANGLLDLPGQAYALVVAGPAFRDPADAAPAKGPTVFPRSSVSLDKIRYSCSDATVASIFDTAPGGGPAQSQAATTFTVRTRAGVILDTETNVTFAAGSVAGASSSRGVPVRLREGSSAANNGILEADTGNLIFARYSPAGQPTVEAAAQVQCASDLIPNFFLTQSENAFGEQFQINGGCDFDQFLDDGEVITYGIALANRSRRDDYMDVVATLTPTGPGAAAVSVLDSPRNVGRLPGAGTNGLFFHVQVNGALMPGTVADRKVTMVLTLDSLNKGQKIATQTYSFTHALHADEDRKHYSTDFPAGGRNVRDLNRNLLIDRPDVLDPFVEILYPDEDVTFASMFVVGANDPNSGTPNTAELVSNLLGEDLDNDGSRDAGERDVFANGVLDRGILFAPGGPTPGADKVPWSFDLNDGGWGALRHPASTPGGTVPPPQQWRYVADGLCGFQTQAGAGKFGIWHTQNGPTPGGSTACPNFAIPKDDGTQPLVEMYMDVLHSPIVAKVNQVPDARGFPHTVEFQRLGFNINEQVYDAYATAGVDIDSNIDDDNFHTFLTQQLDTYYIRLGGGWNDLLFTFGYRYFGYYYQGIDPVGYVIPQRTFGPKVDADNSILASKVFNADDSGFSGFTQDSNPNSFPVIPEGTPDLLAYPVPGASQPGVCTGNTSTPGGPCQTAANCGGPSPICTIAENTVAGPIRNFDTSLVGFEGIDVNEFLFGQALNADFYGYFPGPTGNRWQIGFSFAAVESGADIPDYGFAFDDMIFEWDEWHPQDEGTTNLACSRFGGVGQAAGSQCATITVDRTNLFDCEESVEITVFDATPPPDSDPAPGRQLDVAVVSDSDAVLFSTFRFTTLRPNAKRYKLTEVAGKPGLFRGNVTFSGVANNPTTATSGNVFTNAGADATFIVYYVDFECDADRDGAANESAFENLDGDLVADGVDNCFLIYNPLQEDTDVGGGDGVGNACDNCPTVSNPGQEDANNDNVGDACEFDDVDGDGVDNAADNCKDLYNEDQTDTDGDLHGDACDPGAPVDLDGDGHNNDADNCILAPNGNLRDDDEDLLGSACDGDCRNLTLVRICSNSPTTTCTGAPGTPGAPCPAGGVCQTAVRTANPNTDCSPPAPAIAVDDDADVDGVPDNVDICAVNANPAIIPGTFRQADADRDGLGNQCDPTGTLDDDFEGTPDDLVSFTGTIACRLTQLANFTIVSANYQDIDGDGDIFPDTGETGRVVLTLRNTTTTALPQGFTGIPLTGVSIVMTSSDPDVACVSEPAIAVPGTWAANGLITVGSFNPAQPGLTFKSSNSLSSPNASNPARTELCLSLTNNETLGLVAPKCFSLLSDLDTPPGQTPPARILGPDGLPNTPDDGTLRETFDVDRNSDGNFTIADTLRQPSNTVPGAFDTGFYLKGSDTGVGGIAVIACGGFLTPIEGNTGCVLDPDFPMDWHFHCPTGSGGAGSTCPNVESGPCVDCVGTQTTLFRTPTNDAQAFSPPNSLHFGIHVNDADPEAGGDTVHLRQISAYVSSPINLALLNVAPTELILSFFHIVSLIDNNRFGPGNEGQCVDCAQVHAQRDLNPDPNVDAWGTWDVLQPFQTVYEKKPNAWSTFGPQTCVYTPTDTGTAPPAPRGVHETMCFPQGAWSHCGAARGQTPGNVFDCTGAAGVLDPDGTGVWVESRFNLAGLIGQRVRLRWIAQTWQRNTQASFGHYVQEGGTVANAPDDDGWWLDNINITGVVTTQFTPAADSDPAPTPGPNSANCAVTCSTAVGDNGTTVLLKVTDAAGNILDASTPEKTVVAGQSIVVSAIDSTLPGGCTNGARQFQFFKDGVLVQDWSNNPNFDDAPNDETAGDDGKVTYSAKVRCSADTTCTSATGASITVPIYGCGADQPIFRLGTDQTRGILYFRGTCSAGTVGAPCNVAADCGTGGSCNVTASTSDDTTVLNLNTGPLDPVMDIYRGSAAVTGTGSLQPGQSWLLNATTVCLADDVPVPEPSRQVTQTLSFAADDNPAAGSVKFYAANATPGANIRNANASCANPAKCVNTTTGAIGAATAFCVLDASCPAQVGGTAGVDSLCLNATQYPVKQSGCPLGSDKIKYESATVAPTPCD